MRTTTIPLLALFTLIALPACRSAGTPSLEPDTSPHAAVAQARVGTDPGHAGRGTPLEPRPGTELAAFSGGCYHALENTFRHVPGVVATAVGYAGGNTLDPTYETVQTDTTGHAKTVLVEFDPKVISYATLLDIYFKKHDPTKRDPRKPGNLHRPTIFTLSPAQSAVAKEKEAASLGRNVKTIVAPLGRFWKAEGYHQQYDERTGTHGCEGGAQWAALWG